MAETNNSEIVFTSLEVGDAVLLIYRMENYAFGKLGQQYWSTWWGNRFVPIEHSSMRLLVPTGLDLHISEHNLPANHEKKQVEEFTLYEWAFDNPEKCKDEVFMPTLTEVGISVDFSTIDSWEYVSSWYHDLGLTVGKEDFLTDEAYDNIFGNKSFTNDREKATAIYDYLCENVRYSHVDFRQTGYVPQKPSITLSTQLGDCKDLSLLYHTLAKKAGLNTHLVLVNVRENGEQTMRLPSVEFDHCIIAIDLEGKRLFQELTSEKLPFGALPNTIANAQALIIPNQLDEEVGKELIHLPTETELPAEMHRTTTVTVDEKDLKIQTRLENKGTRASSYRYHLLGLTQERTKEEVENLLNSSFNNHLELNDYSIENLDNREPTFAYTADFTVENELVSLGGLKAIKIPFFEVIFGLDNFPSEDRKHPLVYWLYENTDVYTTQIIFELPEDGSVVEIPEGLTLDNEFINYKLEVEQVSAHQIKINRTVSTKINNIPAERYQDFRETVKRIVEAEDQYVVFK